MKEKNDIKYDTFDYMKGEALGIAIFEVISIGLISLVLMIDRNIQTLSFIIILLISAIIILVGILLRKMKSKKQFTIVANLYYIILIVLNFLLILRLTNEISLFKSLLLFISIVAVSLMIIVLKIDKGMKKNVIAVMILGIIIILGVKFRIPVRTDDVILFAIIFQLMSILALFFILRLNFHFPYRDDEGNIHDKKIY